MNLSHYGNKMFAISIYTYSNRYLNACQVRDEQGRRRLHGAFTGGFSAGYFNTVGSKEGTCFI